VAGIDLNIWKHVADLWRINVVVSSYDNANRHNKELEEDYKNRLLTFNSFFMHPPCLCFFRVNM
jgi:hypothetical protein